MSLSSQIEKLSTWILDAKYVVLFTGAGVSTFSGINYDQVNNNKKNEIEIVGKNPNSIHDAIKSMWDYGIIKTIITLNIDNLHQMSGIPDDKIIELHGNYTKFKCPKCNHVYTTDQLGIKPINPIRSLHLSNESCNTGVFCKKCNNELCSTVINFGDQIDKNKFKKAEDEASKSDLFIVIGSSLKVMPSGLLPKIALLKGNTKLVILSNSITTSDDICGLKIHENLIDVIPFLLNSLKNKF